MSARLTCLIMTDFELKVLDFSIATLEKSPLIGDKEKKLIQIFREIFSLCFFKLVVVLLALPQKNQKV